VRLSGCFPELFGFVLLDPARLDDAFDGDAEGEDLLDLFSTTGQGDEIVRDGVAVPVMGVDAGYYTVIVRHAADPSPWPVPQIASAGWVLGSETGSLVLTGAGYLRNWRRQHRHHRRVAVVPGWYRFEIRGYLLTHHHDDDAAYEFVLTPTAGRPPFDARLDHGFGLVDHGPQPAVGPSW